MLIREATADDWAQIWPIWKAIVEAGETYAYPEPVTSDEARGWWLEPPPGRTVVALDFDGKVIGTAKMGPNRPGRGSHVATASFMVDPAVGSRGTGRKLAEHMIAWATQAGFRSIQFNAVVETNVVAVKLWQDLGFSIIGTVPEAFDSASHGMVGLHVMHRPLP